MTLKVYIDWKKETLLVGRLHTSERSSATSFEYAPEWVGRPDTFAIDPTSLPLRIGPHHAPTLFRAFQDCGPDRWGGLLIERSARKGLLSAPLRQDIDYVLALEDNSRIGALRFSLDKTKSCPRDRTLTHSQNTDYRRSLLIFHSSGT